MDNGPIIIDITNPPAWLKAMGGRVAWVRHGTKISFRLSEAERSVYRKRKRIPPSLWAEKHRVVTSGQFKDSTYRRNTARYIEGILDASFFPSVEHVVLCTTLQWGKSFCLDTCVGYAIDMEPGPVLYVYPDQDTATENCRDRILPMITKSPRLNRHLTGSDDDEGAKRISLRHMPIYMGWAGSVTKLANKSVRHLVLDEVDKYRDSSVRESSPIKLADGRTQAYPFNKKRWTASTPSTEMAAIWTILTSEVQVVFVYWVRCPYCRQFQVMKFRNIRWPEGERDPLAVKAKNLAWYECEWCRSRWSDYDRNRAATLGHWRAKVGPMEPEEPEEEEREEKGQKLMAYLREHRPKYIGFHGSSYFSFFVSISEIAAAFLAYRKTGRLDDLKNFRNRYQALPWRIEYAERKEDQILALQDDRSSGYVPGQGKVCAVVAGVDVQQHGMYYRVRAFGYGPEKESWGIRFGFVDSFEALEKVLIESRFRDADENEYPIWLSLVDSGFRTNEVYAFTRARQPRIVAAKGEDSNRMTQIIAWSNIETYAGTKKPIPGGVRLVRHKANYWKDELAVKLNIKPEDPGAFHVEQDPSLEEYARQMCAEARDESGEWSNPKQKDNHYWDCEVLCFAAAEILKTQDKRKPGEEGAKAQSDKGTKKEKIHLW